MLLLLHLALFMPSVLFIFCEHKQMLLLAREVLTGNPVNCIAIAIAHNMIKSNLEKMAC